MAKQTIQLLSIILFVAAPFFSGCGTTSKPGVRAYVSVPDQKMVVLREVPLTEGGGKPGLQFLAEYPVSTSKFGLGSTPNSYATPLGKHEIAKKIGGKAPMGMKFKDRRPTGEIVAVDAPGRDPIVTRILWLRGLEKDNWNSYQRYIYIHGTPEERNIGKPVSYGCIRMKSKDVVQLYDLVREGDEVTIVNRPLNPKAYLPEYRSRRRLELMAAAGTDTGYFSTEGRPLDVRSLYWVDERKVVR